jgi:hypothetical protein
VLTDDRHCFLAQLDGAPTRVVTDGHSTSTVAAPDVHQVVDV